MDDQTSPILMDLLKRETHDLHTTLEQLPFFPTLADGTLPLVSYVNQLRALATVFGALEHESSTTANPSLLALQAMGVSRFTHLLRDLMYFSGQMIPEIAAVKHRADAMASRIRLLALESPDALLGVFYVLQGTVLGNRVHLPDVRKTFSLAGTSGALFYAGYGDATDEYWSGVASLINAAGAAVADTGQITAAAREAFSFLLAIHSALFPLPNPAHMHFFATTLNPEAGNHAIPIDEREIRAAVAAASACREAYPYFDLRYGDRGKRFGDSDAAWLASLVDLPTYTIITQVAWLGGVLASRGMPCITLEYQLAFLHHELITANPHRQADYDRLRGAIEWLRSERTHSISEATCQKLAQEFAAATDGELGGALRGTGLLLVSAVCDERTGIAGAVTSIEPWLTDTSRFSAGWIAAVHDTIARVRSVAA